MITKEADILYCGVDEEKIKNANPVLNEEVLGYHHSYMVERHKIYKRKEIEKLPQDEWTEDEVFKNYRFTNVRRELDRESVWMIKNISHNDQFTLEEKVLWSMLFRTYNKSSTFIKLGFPYSIDILNFDDKVKETIRTVIEHETEQDPKYVWFTPAFNTGGLKATWAMPETKGMYECTSSNIEVEVETDNGIEKMTWREAKDLQKQFPDYNIKGVEKSMPMRMIHLIDYVRKTDIVERIITAETQEKCYDIIREVDGFSNFLGYQIFVDFTYIPEYKFSENEFTISGPGCDRGLDLIFEDADGMTSAEQLFWIRDNIEAEWKKRNLEANYNELFDHLPEEDRKINVMMCENSFCELSKITSAKRKTGRPRNRYKRHPEDIITPNECSIDEWL